MCDVRGIKRVYKWYERHAWRLLKSVWKSNAFKTWNAGCVLRYERKRKIDKCDLYCKKILSFLVLSIRWRDLVDGKLTPQQWQFHVFCSYLVRPASCRYHCLWLSLIQNHSWYICEMRPTLPQGSVELIAVMPVTIGHSIQRSRAISPMWPYCTIVKVTAACLGGIQTFGHRAMWGQCPPSAHKCPRKLRQLSV